MIGIILGARDEDPFRVFFMILSVLVLISILIGGIALSRKYLFKPEEPDTDPMAGFDIGNLRDLVKQGKMTQEEYEAAKTQIVTNAQKFSQKRNPVKNPAPEKKLGPEDPI